MSLKSDLREEKEDDWEINTFSRYKTVVDAASRYRTKYDEHWEAEYDSDDI